MTTRPNARAALQERLGHRFADPGLLERALTHLSAVGQGQEREESYQRLEFLGDRVLGLAVAAMLYGQFPESDEGELSRRLAELVRAETCAEVAAELELGPALKLGGGEAHSGGRRKLAILADACEAVIGAIYMDAGYEAARAFVERNWHARMLAPRRPLRDGKTALQEWAQGRGLATPTYTMTGRSGPDHSPHFNVRVIVEGQKPADGEGRSKRAAEQAAAQAFLVREGVWTEQNDA